MSSGTSTSVLDVSMLAAGIYTIRVESGEGSRMSKLVITR